MIRTKLAEHLDKKGHLLADGATGTNLFNMGLISGEAPELWNDEYPDRIRALHSGFVEAGSDILLTNTFGCNSLRLKLHNADNRVKELNEKAAILAREAITGSGSEEAVLVAGSIGPTGELFTPLGTLTHDEAVSAFAEQIEGLKLGGADLLWIETMSAPEEVKAAAQAAFDSGLPYAVTASFDTAGKTMMGLSPAEFAKLVNDFATPPIAFGANCGVGAPDLLAAMLEMAGEHPESVLIAKANCGIPQVKGDEVVYTGTPELMAHYTELALDAGMRIIGGCCGTTTEHLSAMRTAMDNHTKNTPPNLECIVEKLGPLVSSPKLNDGSIGRESGNRRRNRRRAQA